MGAAFFRFMREGRIVSFENESARLMDEYIRKAWTAYDTAVSQFTELISIAKSKGDDTTSFERSLRRIEENPPQFPRPTVA